MRSSTRRRSCSRSSRRSTGAASPSAPPARPPAPPPPGAPLRRDLCYLNASCRSAGTWTISATRSRRWRRTAPSTSWTTWSSSDGGPLRSPLLLALALLVPPPCRGHALPGLALAGSGIRSSAADALRRDFVSETRAAIGKMKSAVQDATASSGGALSHTRNELLRGAPLSHLPRALCAALLRCRRLCASLLRRMAVVAQGGQIEGADGLAAVEGEGVAGTATQRATWRAAAPRSSSSSS
eukprot:COSAG04_NODE_694_length_11068_cov_5.641718_5_plen_240_part_00